MSTADGEEAVEKADELRPDLVVLDIGLPAITGIEAARRIRKVSPELKTIFLRIIQLQDIEHVSNACESATN